MKTGGGKAREGSSYVQQSVVTLAARDLAGSRLACLTLTSGSPERVAERLTKVAGGQGTVLPSGSIMPRGLLAPEEAELGRAEDFLNPQVREQLLSWWLAVRRNARVPNWDIAATCRVEGRDGILLVEAKAHDRESDSSGKPEGNVENHNRIRDAIKAANDGLCAVLPGWALSRDRSYQLCNRFAWGWKLATLGVPVVLVFLGVLHADEMTSRSRRAFESFDDWRSVLLEHSKGIVPREAWNTRLEIDGTPLIPLIRTVAQDFSVS